jgi:hypothetical protein
VPKLLIPVAAAVIGAILVTALTPLGENLRELLFPTKADVSGVVTVNGHAAAGARIVLDTHLVAAADYEGKFLLRDVSDGDHTLKIKAVSSRLKTYEFNVERRASGQDLGAIRLVPLAQLGFDPSVDAPAAAYEATLWIIAAPDVLRRIRSVQYMLPSPFRPEAVTVRNGSARDFCLRRRTPFAGNIGARSPAAVVDLGGGRTFPVNWSGGQPVGTPGCPLTGGRTGPPSPQPGPPPPVPNPPPSPQPAPPAPPPPSPRVIVPSVGGQPFESAQALLMSRGFRVTRMNVPSNETVGIVVGQDPRAGTSRPRGSVVAISVSAGPPVLVPDVTQRKEAEAVDKLKGSGFTPRVQQEATANPSEDGVVLDQDPAGGAQAARGSTVTITVGRYQP